MFKQRLQPQIDLTISGNTTKIVPGNIKNFDLELTPWGYRGSAEWWIVCVKDPSEDTLFTPFIANDLISVKITLDRAYDEVTDTELATPKPLVVKGLVVDRRVVEKEFATIKDAPVMHRRYTITFGDRGEVLWSQHRPLMLYVDKTLKDLVEDNKPDGVTIDHSWAASSVTHPILTLPGDPRRQDRGLDWNTTDSTYYDFLHWLLDGLNVGLYYDVANDKYSIADAKPTGSAIDLERQQVDSLEIVFPPVRRDTVTVKNGWTEAATNHKDVTNSVSVTGVKTHFLIRSAIAADLDARTTLETARSQQHNPEVHVVLKRFPSTPLVPGTIVKLDSVFSTKLFPSGKQYRIVTSRIVGKAERQGATDDNIAPTNSYQIDYQLQLELDSDPVVRHAPYHAPVWPFYVEGKVLSETGATDELTFQPYQDSQTSQMFYKVKIPLWDNITVIVPYEPNKLPQKLYIPYQRDERVLISLFFDSARIRQSLEWRPDGGKLPTEQQGEHILVGKVGGKNMTTVSHTYVDSKPVVTMQRKLEDDTQTMTISEGKISWVVKDH